MKETKLVQLLSTLNIKELKAFRQFLQSPYHNSNKQAIRLLEGLSLHHPHFDSHKLEKEAVYRKIHLEGKPYHEGRMNLLMTQLVKLLEQFFAFEEVKKDKFQLSKFKLKAYEHRRLDRAFIKEADKLEASLNKLRKNEQYHLEQFQLNRQVFFHPATPRYQLGMSSLENCLQHLDLFFVWGKLRLAAATFNRMQVLNEEYEIKLLNQTFKQFEADIRQSPVLDFYKKVIMVQQTEEEPLLVELINKFGKILPFLEKEEKEHNLGFLLNLTTQYYRAGKTYFMKSLFLLHKLGLTNELFVQDGKISDTFFINCVSIGSANREFQWTEDFINEYQFFLLPRVQSDVVNLSMAYLNYHQAIYYKNEEKSLQVIDLLQNIDFTIPFFSYRAKSLLLRTYYEYYLQKEEHLDFVLDFTNSFERHITRDKSLGKTKSTAFLNFIKQTRKLIRLRFNRNKAGKNIEIVRANIQKSDNLFAKNWLLEKVGELL